MQLLENKDGHCGFDLIAKQVLCDVIRAFVFYKTNYAALSF